MLSDLRVEQERTQPNRGHSWAKSQSGGWFITTIAGSRLWYPEQLALEARTRTSFNTTRMYRSSFSYASAEFFRDWYSKFCDL